MKGNSKSTSRNSLSPFGAQNKDIKRCFALKFANKFDNLMGLLRLAVTLLTAYIMGHDLNTVLPEIESQFLRDSHRGLPSYGCLNVHQACGPPPLFLLD